MGEGIREENFDSPQNDAQKEAAAASEKANPTTDTDKDLIAQCLNEVKTIRQNRTAFEKQALVNIAFLYGKHYFTIERQTKGALDERILWELKSLEKAKRTRKTMNYILPLYRSLLSRMIQMKQRVTVDPLTNQERDKAASRVSQEALEDFWLNVNVSNPILKQKYAGMLQILLKLFGFMLTVGKGHLMPFYNPNAKAKVLFENLENKPIINAQVGAVEVEVDHWLNVFPDPMGRFKIHKKILPVDYIEELYGVAVKEEEVGLSDIEKQLLQLLEGGDTDRFKNSAEVYTRWELPNKRNPEGRLFVHTKDRMLIKPQAIPPEYQGSIPIYDFDFIDIMLAHPQGIIDQLIPSQEELNHTVSRLHEYKKWFAGKILVPDGTKLSSSYNDQVGQVVKYDASGGKPEFQTPPSPPAFIMQELIRIRKDMEDLAATHDASQGRAQPGIKSGVAIENLSELDQSQLTPVLILIETQLSFFCETVLNIMEEKYSEPRLVGIAGDQLAQDVKTFKGDNVAGNRRVKISLGNNLPVSREARQETIAGWLKAGLITPEEARGMLEFGSLDNILHNLDENAEKMEIQELVKGVQIEVQPWENHSKRIKILTDFLMSEPVIELRKKSTAGDQQATAIMENLVSHRAQHQEALSREMNIMNPKGPGTQPTAPAPAPSAPPVQ